MRTTKSSTVENDRYVDWNDIKGHIEGDDCNGEAPWENCDGWEHEVENPSNWDHDDRTDSYTYYNRGRFNGGDGYVIVDDSDVIKWGCTGPSGCSKQVRFETIAAAKRKATEQLVKWYEDGWHCYAAIASYGDYSASVGGIYDDVYGYYAHECAEEMRHEVAYQMERDGYIIKGEPTPVKYSRVDAMRDRIHRNLDCSI